jgi:hypothetical protein
LVEVEVLYIAIASEEAAVELVSDALGYILESSPDRSLDGVAGVVRDQPDDRHRDEAEQDKERGQFSGDAPRTRHSFHDVYDQPPSVLKWQLVRRTNGGCCDS